MFTKYQDTQHTVRVSMTSFVHQLFFNRMNKHITCDKIV